MDSVKEELSEQDSDSEQLPLFPVVSIKTEPDANIVEESLADAPEVVPSDLTSELESGVATPNENKHIPVTSDRSSILAAMRRAMSAGVTPNNHLVPDDTDELICGDAADQGELWKAQLSNSEQEVSLQMLEEFAVCQDDAVGDGSSAQLEPGFPTKQEFPVESFPSSQAGKCDKSCQTAREIEYYKCKVCKKVFPTKKSLMLHILSHTDKNPYKCDMCSKTFLHSGNLARHRRSHKGEKPYTCDLCKTNFSRRETLQRHFRTHTREKPFKCEICNKAFSDSGYLVTHRRTHTGEKPYKCDMCNKEFTQGGNLTRHKTTSGVCKVLGPKVLC